MNLVSIKVESYSGYKADEFPRAFFLYNIRFEIEEIKDRWYQTESTPEWPVSDYFKVKTSGGAEYILKHELHSNQWFLRL